MCLAKYFKFQLEIVRALLNTTLKFVYNRKKSSRASFSLLSINVCNVCSIFGSLVRKFYLVSECIHKNQVRFLFYESHTYSAGLFIRYLRLTIIMRSSEGFISTICLDKIQLSKVNNLCFIIHPFQVWNHWLYRTILDLFANLARAAHKILDHGARGEGQLQVDVALLQAALVAVDHLLTLGLQNLQRAVTNCLCCVLGTRLELASEE